MACRNRLKLSLDNRCLRHTALLTCCTSFSTTSNYAVCVMSQLDSQTGSHDDSSYWEATVNSSMSEEEGAAVSAATGEGQVGAPQECNSNNCFLTSIVNMINQGAATTH